MTEANPDGSNTPEQEPTNANLDKSSAPAQESAMPKPRRPNEFWLALASTAAGVLGIAATAAVGIWAAHLAYKSSTNQIKAESDRAAIQFSKEKRKDAYTDYLTAETDLRDEMYKMWQSFDHFVSGQMSEDKLSDQYSAWIKACDADLRADSEVRLVASRSVARLIGQWDDYDDKVHDQIVGIKIAINAHDLTSASGKTAALNGMVGPDNAPSLDHFVDIAKADLGLSA